MNQKELIPYYDDILSLYQQGVTLRKIGKKYGSGHATIKGILIKNGDFIENREVLSVKIPECEHQNIINCYDTGDEVEEIAEAYNVGHVLIRRILKNYGIHVMMNKPSKYKVNKHYFDKIDNQDKAYILGLLYADGYNIPSKNLVGIELQEEDSYIIEKIRDNMESDFPIRFRELKSKNPNWKNHKIFNIINHRLSVVLNNLGVFPNKSLILEFPTFLPDNMMPHFLRGYFDGDGHIPKKKYSRDAQFISTRNFCEAAQKYLKDLLDINSVVTLNIKDPNSPRYNGITCTWRIKDKESSKKFYDYIYKDANMYLERKYKVYTSKF